MKNSPARICMCLPLNPSVFLYHWFYFFLFKPFFYGFFCRFCLFALFLRFYGFYDDVFHSHFLLFSKNKEYFLFISPLGHASAPSIPYQWYSSWNVLLCRNVVLTNPQKAPCMEVKTYPCKVLLRNVLSHFITANFYWTIFFSLRALRFFFSWYILSSASLMYSSILIESSSAMT